MALWTEPNVLKHVKDNTDYRLSNLFEKLIIYSQSSNVGDYYYDVTGETTTKIEVYDVSTTALMDKFYELRDKCGTAVMGSEDNYTTPKIANERYKNVTLWPLILLMNNMASNAEFVLDSSAKFNVLSSSDVEDLLLKQSSATSNTVQEVTDVDEYYEKLESLVRIKNKYDPTTDELVSSKMRSTFTDVEDKPEYKRLVSEFGETEVNRIIMLLTSYNKEASEDNGS